MSNTITFEFNAGEITKLFIQANSGEKDALNKLVDVLYFELKKIAASRRKSFSNSQTLNTTALVNETWLKLKSSDIKYNNKKHFLSIAAVAMRQILLDSARRRKCQKRPDLVAMDFTDLENLSSVEAEAEWLYQLDLILIKLEKHSPRKAAVFNLKFFCGFTLAEIAELFDITIKTVHRDWQSGKQIISTTFKLSSKD